MLHRDFESHSETRIGAVTRFECAGVRIYQIPVQSFVHHFTNTYLILDGGAASLIDVGFHGEKAMADFMSGLASVRRDFEEDVGISDVANIIVTHGHDDHFGMLSFDRLKGRRLYMNGLDSQVLTDYRGEDLKWRDACRRLVCEAGCSVDMAGLWPFEDLAVQPGDYRLTLVSDGEQIINGYSVLGTPGHTPGHICIGIGTVLFLGDHMLSVTTPHQVPRTGWCGCGLAVYLESLRSVAGLGMALGLPAHEDTIYSIRDRAEEIERFHYRRLEELTELCASEKTLHSITDDYYRRHPELIQASGIDALDTNEFILALEEVKAHLEYLVDNGQLLSKAGEDGVVRYSS